MDVAALTAHIEQLAGVVTMMNADDAFFIYDPGNDLPDERKMPFATIVVADRYDTHSDLDRPGVFRLNIGLPKASHRALFGGSETAVDFTALDRLMPHPVYGAQHWICVLNPETTLAETLHHLAEAHAYAVRKFENQHARKAWPLDRVDPQPATRRTGCAGRLLRRDMEPCGCSATLHVRNKVPCRERGEVGAHLPASSVITSLVREPTGMGRSCAEAVIMSPAPGRRSRGRLVRADRAHRRHIVHTVGPSYTRSAACTVHRRHAPRRHPEADGSPADSRPLAAAEGHGGLSWQRVRPAHTLAATLRLRSPRDHTARGRNSRPWGNPGGTSCGPRRAPRRAPTCTDSKWTES